MLDNADLTVLLPPLGVAVVALVLSRFVRCSDAAAGLREALGSRSALLAKLLSCSRCLCFWLSLFGALAASDSLPGVAISGLFSWFFCQQMNRKLDQRAELTTRRTTDRSCRICHRPYQRGFLLRYGQYFCSYRCWFDYLKARPRPTEGLMGPGGEPVRQELYTTPWRDIDVEEAKRLLDAGGHVYLDVRSAPEFRNGHPAGACNVPLLERDRFGLTPNADFLKTVRAAYEPTTKLIVGCQSGARSRRAAEVLSAAGFAEVYHVTGGYGGVRGERGQVVARGWFESGYAVDYGAGPDPGDH